MKQLVHNLLFNLDMQQLQSYSPCQKRMQCSPCGPKACGLREKRAASCPAAGAHTGTRSTCGTLARGWQGGVSDVHPDGHWQHRPLQRGHVTSTKVSNGMCRAPSSPVVGVSDLGEFNANLFKSRGARGIFVENRHPLVKKVE